jgi:hypothetical protein
MDKDFVPDFTADGYGEYGYWEWFDYHVGEHHHKLISVMEVEIMKSTHAGCCCHELTCGDSPGGFHK